MNINYKYDEMSFRNLKEKIKLPKFQRSLVWSADKKQNFINTILCGDPFGTLLLYQNDDGTYRLVDGLQRFSTLVDFSVNPTNYFDLQTQYEDDLNKIFQYISDAAGDIKNLKKDIIKGISQCFVLDKKPQAYQMRRNLIEIIPIFKNNYPLYDILGGILKQ